MESGTTFSLAALGDCSFVTVRVGIDVSGRPGGNVLVESLGLVSFENPDGNCYWYNGGGDPFEQMMDYFDFLGGKWQVARIIGAVGVAGGIHLFLSSICLCCFSHSLAVRLFRAIFLSVMLPLSQCLTFLVFTSDLCQERGCRFSRSAGWSLGAIVCFMGSGFCYVFMNDYPGKRSLKASTQEAQNARQSPNLVPPVEHQAPIREVMIGTEEYESMEDREEPAIVPIAPLDNDGKKDWENGPMDPQEDNSELVQPNETLESTGVITSPRLQLIPHHQLTASNEGLVEV